MNRVGSSLLLILSALALALSFSPLPLHFLSYVALMPLFARIEFGARKGSFWSGFFFGFSYGLFLLFWLLFLVVPPVIKAWLVFGYVLLAAFIGFYFAAFSLMTKWLGLFWAPFILVALEYTRSIGEIGFPWGVLGYTQTSYLPVIQLASIFGIWGVSFLIVLVNIFAYRTLSALVSRTPWHRPLVYLVGTVFVVLVYGTARIGHRSDDKIRVAVVQPNIDPNSKSTREMKQKMFDILREDSELVKDYGVDLMILPETALPINLERERVYYEQARHISDTDRHRILSGSLLYGYNLAGGLEVYNGAILFVPDSGIVQKYRKMRLVPFSEKIPYSRQVPFLRKADFGGGDFTHGQDYVLFRVGDKRGATLICFESIFGDLTRNFTKKGCDFLVNITNDGWFGNTPGPYQHAEMAVVRAVENRMPLVRCANTGVSFVVDQFGRVSNKTRIFERALVVADVPMGAGKSLYMRLGDFLPQFSIGIVSLMLLVTVILRNRLRPGPDG